MAYPAPSRQRWAVAVEFLDGTRIVGADDADVVDRWWRLGWGDDPDRDEFKTVRAQRARAFYGAGLIGIGADTPDRLFLDALAAEGCLTVIRKNDVEPR